MNLNNRNRRYRNRLLVGTAMAGATLLGLGQVASSKKRTVTTVMARNFWRPHGQVKGRFPHEA
ncbi:hypothetical protein [Mesorhizobium sp. CO1-1-8]|uniref:hypothetical protein n=1 Tax=Mesorhizobium sp. CO1-1-8 TaxID=2876631 RepID=UPI001CD0E707|nr:hypothetical protein [Mesorhizobium sp. CO1-1-8]MBZ9774268.1 hypothetical protein [Mesorhizobium sp. CO1-1-8]